MLGASVSEEKILEKIIELFQELKGSEEAEPQPGADGPPKDGALEIIGMGDKPMDDEKKGMLGGR